MVKLNGTIDGILKCNYDTSNGSGKDLDYYTPQILVICPSVEAEERPQED